MTARSATLLVRYGSMLMLKGDLIADFGNFVTWITYGIDIDPYDEYGYREVHLDTWQLDVTEGVGVEYAGQIQWNASEDEQVIIERPTI